MNVWDSAEILLELFSPWFSLDASLSQVLESPASTEGDFVQPSWTRAQ